FIQDIRYGVRMLPRNPGFAVVAIVTLALGIGANTAIFSVVDAVLLKPLPYKNADRLVIVWEKAPNGIDRVSGANFLDWREQSRVFEGMAAGTTQSFNLSGIREPEQILGGHVSANYFDLIGMKALLGRTFLPEEEQSGKDRVVVLAHKLWRS